ncbi:MAG: NADPH-dependent glutamate synthase [Spirochaetales bacterium]|nr:NADPH-dependent glutamate synthase [Spirochaetales bacterium]
MSFKSEDLLRQEAIQILTGLNGTELKIKDKMKIPLQEMPSQDPEIRRNNMQEVALGYTKEQARVEALRCLDCKTKPCIKGCPVAIDIPGFIMAIAKDDLHKSMAVLNEATLLPAICGRVCPQEKQCQAFCTLGKSLKDPGKAVSIGRLERYIADWARRNSLDTLPEIAPETGKKVAVIGSGPAGLSCAADLRRAGHKVTIYEALHKTGGVMVYGIPEFRLPKAIVEKEINRLERMGVEIRTDCLVSKTKTIDDLLNKDKYDALFIGSGAGLPRFLKLEGENLIGVFSANEYLTRSNLMRAYDDQKAATPLYRGDKVAVLGGGNVAMDSARTAIRLGSKEVHLIYRRSEAELPARLEEIEHAKEEGVIFHFLKAPKSIKGNEKGRVIGLETLDCILGEPDDSGRRRPVIQEDSARIMDMDVVIIAIGNDSNPLIKQTTPDLETNKWGNIIADENCKTSMEKVWAGGDIVLGAATVILAMGQGRTAAASINKYLS